MGEAAASSCEQVVKIEDEECAVSAAEAVRWGSCLPSTVLRVLLVEADDSTRQIITALLRKCNYRVLAVADGLKAWEAIKGKHEKIDIILTEAELPSISGFALLTLVMEHDMCKNIPVIMMSSQDSVNLVLKCMLKGAADYLIKPVRKNELTNLWQHVWRRHTLTGGQAPRNMTVSRQKLGATSQNKAKKEFSEKESDAQNSCTTPYMEAQSACIQNMQDMSQLNYGIASKLTNTDIERLEECGRLDNQSFLHENESKEHNSSGLRAGEDNVSAKAVVLDESIRPEYEGNTNIASETHNCHYELAEPSIGVMDFLGTFDNWPNCNFGGSNSKHDATKNLGCAPQLELSLRSLGADMQLTEEVPALNHSDASAFSRYNNSKEQTLYSTLTSTKSEDASNSRDAQEILATLVADQTFSFQDSEVEVFPVTGARSDNMRARQSQFFPSLFPGQSDVTPIVRTKSDCWSAKAPFHYSEKVQDGSDKSACKYNDQMVNEQKKVDRVEHLRPGSQSASQSACSSLDNGTVDNHISGSTNGSICSSNEGNTNVAVAGEMAAASESFNDGPHLLREGFGVVDSLRSSQREAALTKFRMKRKDRCFDKKVRYQSRKLLAEKRPRVKGQFVHRALTDTPTANAVGS